MSRHLHFLYSLDPIGINLNVVKFINRKTEIFLFFIIIAFASLKARKMEAYRGALSLIYWTGILVLKLNVLIVSQSIKLSNRRKQ
jgi:hypothetical protein